MDRLWEWLYIMVKSYIERESVGQLEVDKGDIDFAEMII